MPDDVIRVTLGSHESIQEAKALAQQYAHSNPGQDIASAPKAFSPSGHDVGQVHSITVGSQQHSPAGSGFGRVTASELAPIDGGVLSTARSPKSGGPVAGDSITADTIVTVDGFDMSASIAARMGYLRFDRTTGRYEDINAPANAVAALARPQESAGQRQEAEQPQDQQMPQGDQPQQGEDIEPFSDDLEAHIGDFQKVGNIDFEAGLSQMITTGEMSESTAVNIAGQLGIPATEVQERATALRTAFEDQAKDMTGASGEVLPYIIETMMAIDPNGVNRAMRDHVEQGKRNAYDGLLSKFFAELPKLNPDAILTNTAAQQMGVRRESNGDITINVPGYGRTTWQAAIRGGLISPTYRKA